MRTANSKLRSTILNSALIHHQIITQIPAPDGSKRHTYQLTEKGQALRPLLVSMRDWGLKWEKGTKAMISPNSKL